MCLTSYPVTSQQSFLFPLLVRFFSWKNVNNFRNIFKFFVFLYFFFSTFDNSHHPQLFLSLFSFFCVVALIWMSPLSEIDFDVLGQASNSAALQFGYLFRVAFRNDSKARARISRRKKGPCKKNQTLPYIVVQHWLLSSVCSPPLFLRYLFGELSLSLLWRFSSSGTKRNVVGHLLISLV